MCWRYQFGSIESLKQLNVFFWCEWIDARKKQLAFCDQLSPVSVKSRFKCRKIFNEFPDEKCSETFIISYETRKEYFVVIKIFEAILRPIVSQSFTHLFGLLKYFWYRITPLPKTNFLRWNVFKTSLSKIIFLR